MTRKKGMSDTRSPVGSTLLAIVAFVLLLGSAPSVASAALDVSSFTTGSSTTTAGAHADVHTNITFAQKPDGMPTERVRNIILELPVGLLGSVRDTPECPARLFHQGAGSAACPPASQVGEGLFDHVDPNYGPLQFVGKIYNLETPIGEPARLGISIPLGFVVAGAQEVQIAVRNATDYGLVSTAAAIPRNYNLVGINLALWGVPADHGVPTERRPFMMNPTDCSTVPVTKLRADSYEEPDKYVELESSDPKPTDCDQLQFKPTISVKPDSAKADAPTGLGVRIDMPQNDDPDGQMTPALRDAVVDLPEGMTINPGAADGLAACSDAQSAIGTNDAASCPEASKIGTVKVDVPALREPLDGAVYIGTQQSDDPASGKMFRMFLVANGQGVHLKLEGAVRADPASGQLRATFRDNPQAPAASIDLHFKGGPRAVLANPAACGTKVATGRLSSWGGPSAEIESTFTVDCAPGLGWFGPYFSAGTVNPQAGGAAPFALRINKPDGQSDLNGIALSLPEGLLANLKGNVGTRIGTARVAAGPGSQPFWLDGPVVLEGPYGDAPFSLRVTVPAIAGPFNLGGVVVRQKIYVNPHDAHVTVVSDPLPTIVKGVPVRLQSLNVDVDKPGFMINPTSCAPKSIGGTLAASTGQTASVASRFQVGGCKNLPLAPKLSLDLIGKKEVKRGKHPQLSTTLTQQPGESGLKKVAVRLPLSLALDPDNAQALCKPEQAAAKACPAGSIIGKATAVSPVLNRPLTGDVFFVEGTRQTEQGRTAKTMPKLWVALRGEVALDVWADSSLEDSKYLVTTFGFIPDAPISSFKLDIDGGKHGILAVTGKSDANLCQKPLVAKAQFDGQNGKEVRSHPVMGSPCRFRVQDKTLYSTRTKVRVSGIGAGKLTLSGKGIKKSRRTIKRADVASITAKLTSSGKRAYRGRKAVRLKVSFNPSAKGEKTHRLKTTVKRAKAKKAKKKSSSTRSHRSR